MTRSWQYKRVTVIYDLDRYVQLKFRFASMQERTEPPEDMSTPAAKYRNRKFSDSAWGKRYHAARSGTTGYASNISRFV